MVLYMKRFIVLLLCLMATAGPAAGDGRTGGRPRVVTTIFPLYDWTREILGDAAASWDLTLLLDSGVDLHSYQPTVQDIAKVSTCDLFVCVGGESEGWVKDALKNATRKGQVAMNLLDLLGPAVKEEKRVEGMEEEAHDHDHDHEHDEHEHDEHEAELDEHVWLSLRNAEAACRHLAEALAKVDPAHGEAYAANAARYIERLQELDGRYRAAVEGGVRRVILFGDRFPFRYLADDYGLTYYAAFAGCSAETEASFATVTFLAARTEELGLPCVLTLEGSRHRIAETVVANTRTKDQRVLSMDSMQSATLRDAREGATYLSIMEKNLETLKAALN